MLQFDTDPAQTDRLPVKSFFQPGLLSLNPWRALSAAIGVFLSVPFLVVLLSWVELEPAIWSHLAQTQLSILIYNSLLLALGVGLGVFVVGVSLAWLVATCEFPGRKVFEWLLLLPLAIPTYVLAFVALGIMDFFGPVQTFFRHHLEWNVSFDARHPLTVILVMTLVLYPYVFMLARASFLKQGRSTLEAARSLGYGAWRTFVLVSLPMARPAIAVGVSLALMETLADFGAVSAFNFDTFTTAIYKTWYGLFNMMAAAQLASLLLLFIAVILVMEKKSRKNASFVQSDKVLTEHRVVLRGFKKVGATSYACLVSLLAFVVPVVQLMLWSFQSMDDIDGRFIDLAYHTFLLGLMAAALVVMLALLVNLVHRQRKSWASRLSMVSTSLGYALPGSVLAVGIMVMFTVLDHHVLAPFLSSIGIQHNNQWLSGSIFGLLLAYCVRFSAVASGPVQSSLEQFDNKVIDAARTLEASRQDILLRIILPMMKPGLLTAVLLVMVDVMKEMPATMLLRPFGWDTLAVRIYEMTSEGEWERAALPATLLVLIGLMPVIFLVKKSR